MNFNAMKTTRLSCTICNYFQPTIVCFAHEFCFPKNLFLMRFLYNTIGLMVISGPDIMLSSSVGLVTQCPPITDDEDLQQQVDRVLGMDLNFDHREEICKRLRQIKEQQEGLKTTLRAIERAVDFQKLRERISSICPGKSLGNEELTTER